MGPSLRVRMAMHRSVSFFLQIVPMFRACPPCPRPQYFHFLSQLARSGLLDHEATGDLIHSLVAKLHAHPIREPLGCEEWRADQVCPPRGHCELEERQAPPQEDG